MSNCVLLQSLYDQSQILQQQTSIEDLVYSYLKLLPDFVSTFSYLFPRKGEEEYGDGILYQNDSFILQDRVRLPEKDWREYPICYQDCHFGSLFVPKAEEKENREEKEEFLQLLDAFFAGNFFRLLEALHASTLQRKLEAESKRNSLLFSIAHDLRLPLTGIIGVSELLLEQNPDFTVDHSEQRELLKGIKSDATRLHDILENVLSLVRFNHGNFKIKKEPEALEEIIEEAILSMKRGAYKNREILFENGEDLILAPVDSRLIYQVLLNLLDNACKHSPTEAPVKVELASDEALAHISVIDEGEGIDPKNSEEIFNLFYTTQAKHSDKKGSGLGLPICHAIMKAHNGSISARNRNDRSGCIFTISIPMIAAY